MHRCLAIKDTQQVIFSEFRRDYKGKATLARLARTCWLFNHVALDLLWEKLDSFTPLVLCLPSTLWQTDNSGKRLGFKRTMSLGDWEIFCRYASRVRSISIKSYRLGPFLADDVFFALSHPPHFGPLLPNIRKLTWSDWDAKYTPLLHVLISDSLVDIALSPIVLRSPEVRLQLAFRCPSLKDFRIISTDLPLNAGDDQKTRSEIMMSLHSLKSFCSGKSTLHESAIVHLARLPTLLDLSLELQDDLKLEVLKPHLIPPAFASLRSLKLQTNELSTLTPLLALVHLKLQDISILARNVPHSDTCCLFFTTLAKACDPEHLSRVKLIDNEPRNNNEDRRYTTSLSMLEPLLTFPKIESFTLNVMHDVSFDDNALDILTKRWPKLTKLSLNETAGWGCGYGVSGRALVTLLSRCTALRYFALDVNFGIDKVPMTRPGNGVTSRCQEANFITSIIDDSDPPRVAAFLSDLCPELLTVSSSWDESGLDGEGYAERWEEVDRLVPIFLAVRAQCKEWYERREKARECQACFVNCETCY